MSAKIALVDVGTKTSWFQSTSDPYRVSLIMDAADLSDDWDRDTVIIVRDSDVEEENSRDMFDEFCFKKELIEFFDGKEVPLPGEVKIEWSFAQERKTKDCPIFSFEIKSEDYTDETVRTKDNAVCRQKTSETPHDSSALLNENIAVRPIKLEDENVDVETMETEDSAISMQETSEAHGSTVLLLNKNISVRSIKLEPENVGEKTMETVISMQEKMGNPHVPDEQSNENTLDTPISENIDRRRLPKLIISRDRIVPLQNSHAAVQERQRVRAPRENKKKKPTSNKKKSPPKKKKHCAIQSSNKSCPGDEISRHRELQKIHERKFHTESSDSELLKLENTKRQVLELRESYTALVIEGINKIVSEKIASLDSAIQARLVMLQQRNKEEEVSQCSKCRASIASTTRSGLRCRNCL
ncbi:hypothetical protein QAD02_020890 [Eretmocerus hayati]|uniref:Uncharacterized protein n=1 Tax=Eretmocerus hayati TaxID=131215 RepID=A0ACC2PNW4_9HYME|nr:hypothetical protein QAD02_020890 [Eretmocerus hayati]